MHRSLTVGLGAGALAAAVTLGGLALPTGGRRVAASVLLPVRGPPAAAELTGVRGLRQLLRWYVDRAIDRVGP